MNSKDEIILMKVETRLDRLQCQLRANYKQSCLALGEIRSVLEYHKGNRQKTLLKHISKHPSGLKTSVVNHEHNTDNTRIKSSASNSVKEFG